MKTKLFFLTLTLFVFSSCSMNYAELFIHRTEVNGGEIFGYPKYGFFYDKEIANEIKKHRIKLTKEEYIEIKKLLDVLKTKPDLEDIELGEGPKDIALIIDQDTLYGYNQSWIWKKKATFFESSTLRNFIEKHKK